MRWIFAFALLLVACTNGDTERELRAKRAKERIDVEEKAEAQEKAAKLEKSVKSLKAANASCHAVCASDAKACAGKCILASCRDRCEAARSKCAKACGEVDE